MGRGGLRYGEGHVERRGDRFRVRYVDADGRRRSRTFATEVEARGFLFGRDRTKAEPAALTVREVVEDYLRRGARRWQAGTLVTYRQRAKDHILPHLGRVAADRLTTVQVQRWVDALDADGLAAGTIQPALAILSGALGEAVRLGLVDRNVAQGVKVPRAERRPATVWTPDEARAVLSVAQDDPRWHAVYQLMLSVGLRPGELRALQWGDVEWDRARLRVRRTVAKRAGGGVEVRAGTKRGAGRTVPLALPVIAALRAWHKHNGSSLWIFAADGPLPNMTWQRAHRDLCARAQVPVIRLHDLRHAAASLLIERGVSMRVVAEILGHTSIETTMDIYATVDVATMRRAVEGLADGLNEDRASPGESRRSAVR